MSENAKQAQEMPEIRLTLTPDEVREENNEKLEELEQKQEKQVSTKDPLESIVLSESEKATIDSFSQQIDITKSDITLQYGAAAQKKVSDFSDAALKNIRTKDLGEVGKLLNDLVVELKDFDGDDDEKKGFFASLFDKGQDKATRFKIKYDSAEKNVEKVASMLEEHQITLLKDIALLDELYERNNRNSKELAMYILAGRKKLTEVREKQLPELIAKAKASGLPEDAQAANDLENKCDRFEKKLHDLELTRTISMQTAPQIRMIQNNDTTMIEKIQTTIVNTIPLWKSQMVLALGIAHSTEAAQAQRQVTDLTNELLKKNAETLHLASVETAKESERGIVDIETLKKTNQELIQTLDDVMKIQQEGREKRQAAEADMRRMENELKTKLLEIRR